MPGRQDARVPGRQGDRVTERQGDMEAGSDSVQTYIPRFDSCN